MTLPILAVILLLFVLVGVATRAVLLRCAHLDAEGHSALYWQRDGHGRLCGWCPLCGRMTRGWRIG